MIADVSGHNVGAALIMAETRTFIQARAQAIGGVGEIMQALNDFFYDDLTRAELFITMAFLRYEPQSRQVVYASAGHNPPIISRARGGTCERLDAEGLILGVKREVHFEEKSQHLDPGDLLLLYTDGVTEAENPQGELFGEGRLCEVLRSSHHLPPQQILETVLAAVRKFTGAQSFQDDVSLVVLKIMRRTPELD